VDIAPETIHATCIAVAGRAALLRGPAGSGKSDLALRCLALGAGPFAASPARLVADDRVILHRFGDRLVARCPATISGKLEVNGIGVIEIVPEPEARVVVLIDLIANGKPQRLPEPPLEMVAGVPIPVIRLKPFEASAPLKVLIAINDVGVACLPCSGSNA